ncbi:Coniferyl alcohol acyltransferase [Linum grandiflorum]
MGSICDDDVQLLLQSKPDINKQTSKVPSGTCENSFTVTLGKKELVAAVLPMQEHWLPLSNLDLLLPPVDVGVFFCYSHGGAGAVGKIKKGLAQALVTYYAFAGEVVMNSGGEPEIVCNNRGVEFWEAYADVELGELDLYNPDDAVEGKLVPVKKDGVFAVQVTELRCGGIVVGCSFDHRIADAYSCNMFLVAWAESTKSRPISSPPSFRRSLLNPRRPLTLDPTLDDMYVPLSTLPPPPPPSSDDPVLLSRIYYVKSDDLAALQSLTSRTKLESFCAFLWQLVAKSSSSSQSDAVSKMGIVVNGRSRLADMNRYFGNVLSIPYGGKRVGELVESSLSHVADGVHEFLEKGTSGEHFLGLVDWVEAHRPEPAISKIYSCGGAEGPAFVVSSGRGFPVGEVDFGWGRPVFGSYHFPWGGSAGYVMPMPSPKKSEDWVVYMHLFEEQLEVIEKEGGSVFRPFSWDYVM